MENDVKTESEKRDKLLRIIQRVHTALLVTRGATGGMHARPMASAAAEENFARLWFATSIDSAKVYELNLDNRILCAYVNSSGSEWATVNGRGRLVTDRSKIEELWSPFWRNWFEGPDDPKIALIEVIPETAEYWDSGSRILSAVKLAIAAVTGAKMDEGDNQTVTLHSGG